MYLLLTLCRLGNQRRVTVYKTKGKVDTSQGKENLPPFAFSKEAKEVLQELFTQYPPDDREGEEIGRKHSETAKRVRENTHDFFFKPSMDKAEIAKRVKSLASRVENSPDLRQVLLTYHSEFLSFIFPWLDDVWVEMTIMLNCWSDVSCSLSFAD